jgi:tetratricopeptide (TPR) repeat protein
VFVLVDRLSTDISKLLLAQLTELPELAVSRLTTDRLPALLAYLEGEQKYRRSNFREALTDYSRAVEADSTFALALYRLSEAYAWLEGFSERVEELARRANRYADRLPEREALLLRGTLELDELRLSSIQTLEEATTLYPDDVEAWHKLGEACFFLCDAGFYPREKFRDALRRAIELDPNFGQLYQHLVDDAFHRQDSVAAGELIAALRQIDPTSREPIGLSLTYTLVWGDSISQARARAALDTAHTDVLVSALRALIWSADLRDKQLPISVALTAERHPIGLRGFGHGTTAITYFLWGQIGKAHEHLAFLPEQRQRFWDLIPHVVGYPDSVRANNAAEAAAAAPTPSLRFWSGALAAKEGRWGDVADLHRALTSSADLAEAEGNGAEAERYRWFAQALGGYATLQRGEVRAAIQEMEAALPIMPGLYTGVHQLLRYELGKLMLDAGRPRDAGRYFHSLDYEHLFIGAPIEFYLGRVYEALGDNAQAGFHYERFVRWWQDCDPELRPMWEQGRVALARVRR